MNEPRLVTPAEVARRVAALGVIINPATVWAFLRHRAAAEYPGRSLAEADALSLTDDELEFLLDEFLDVVEVERSRLSRAMQSGESATPQEGRPE